MPTCRLRTTKTGKRFYEIAVSRGYGKSPYTMRWYVPDGWGQKAITRELNTVAEDFQRRCKAGEVLTKKEQKARAEQVAQEAAKVLTLQQYSEQVFIPTLNVTCSENTRSTYQGQLNKHIYPVLGKLKMPDITPANITALLLNLQSSGKAHASVIKTYTILHSLFKMAYMSDTIEKNPMDKVARPKPRKDEVQPETAKAYTIEELQYIMKCLSQEPLKWRAFISLLIDTGIRRGECTGLKWENVDFTKNTITIRGNLQYTPQKGVYLDTPKNGKYRTIDVDSDTMKLLKEMRQENTLSPYVFSQENSAAPMHPQSPTRYMKKFEEKYGIKDFHPHKLRHSFASAAITAGADVASVSEKLGHSDKAITLRMYTHANQASIKRAGEIFRTALKGTTEL